MENNLIKCVEMLLMLRKYRDSDGEAAAPCPVLLTIHISPHQAVRALHVHLRARAYAGSTHEALALKVPLFHMISEI